jgi:DNA-binding NarL/FixJ family response regulator
MRCVIVDDNTDFVDAVRSLLERQGISVVGAAANSAEALRCVEKLRPDVTLVDINLGTESGFELAEQLHRQPVSTAVILISTHAAQDFADLIAASPALGFLSKSSLSTDAIRYLVDGSASLEERDHR